jgi:hypothetical protein
MTLRLPKLAPPNNGAGGRAALPRCTDESGATLRSKTLESPRAVFQVGFLVAGKAAQPQLKPDPGQLVAVPVAQRNAVMLARLD